MLILFSTVFLVAVTINKCLFHLLVHFYKQFLSASLSSPRPCCLVLVASSSSCPHRPRPIVASSSSHHPRCLVLVLIAPSLHRPRLVLVFLGGGRSPWSRAAAVSPAPRATALILARVRFRSDRIVFVQLCPYFERLIVVFIVRRGGTRSRPPRGWPLTPPAELLIVV